MSFAQLIRADIKCFILSVPKTSSVCPLIITKVGHLQCMSHLWNLHNSFPFTYQTHDLIVVIQTETFRRHRLSTNKQATRREKKITEIQREKGENSSVVHPADDILCTLSVISFSSVKMDRISPHSLTLSLGWLLHWSPWRHLFPLSLSLLSLSSSQWLLFSWNFMN